MCVLPQNAPEILDKLYLYLRNMASHMTSHELVQTSKHTDGKRAYIILHPVAREITGIKSDSMSNESHLYLLESLTNCRFQNSGTPKIIQVIGRVLNLHIPIWLWINTYTYHFWGDEHPFTSYFDVHQG